MASSQSQARCDIVNADYEYECALRLGVAHLCAAAERAAKKGWRARRQPLELVSSPAGSASELRRCAPPAERQIET